MTLFQLKAMAKTAQEHVAKLNAALEDFTKEPESSPEVKAIQAAVAEHFGIEVDEILARGKPHRIAYPRHISMYLCRLRGYGYQQISSAHNRPCHGTAVHAYNCVKTLLEIKDKQTTEAVKQLKQKLNIE